MKLNYKKPAYTLIQFARQSTQITMSRCPIFILAAKDSPRFNLKLTWKILRKRSILFSATFNIHQHVCARWGVVETNQDVASPIRSPSWRQVSWRGTTRGVWSSFQRGTTRLFASTIHSWPPSPIHIEVMDIIASRVDPDAPAKNVVRSLMMSTIGQRDYSAQEAIHIVQGWPLFSASREFITIAGEEEWHRVEVMQEDLRVSLPLMNKNRQRPLELEDVSLLSFSKKWYVKAGRYIQRRHDAIVRIFPRFTFTTSKKTRSIIASKSFLIIHFADNSKN